MNAYREQGDAPMYPKEETFQEKRARFLSHRAKCAALGVCVATAFPCAMAMGIGVMWQGVSAAVAAAACIAAVIASIGVSIAISIGLDGVAPLPPKRSDLADQ